MLSEDTLKKIQKIHQLSEQGLKHLYRIIDDVQIIHSEHHDMTLSVKGTEMSGLKREWNNLSPCAQNTIANRLYLIFCEPTEEVFNNMAGAPFVDAIGKMLNDVSDGKRNAETQRARNYLFENCATLYKKAGVPITAGDKYLKFYLIMRTILQDKTLSFFCINEGSIQQYIKGTKSCFKQKESGKITD